MIGGRSHSQTRSIMNIYVSILIIVAIFIPFVIINYRSQIGTFLSAIINGIGQFALAVGGLYIVLGFFGVFTHSHNWVKQFVYGVVLLWVGCWCTGTIIDFFGFQIGGL
ncbi:MAG: hypothetical protein ACFE96_17190 [Candidatus Hermodarchaeota archaeon]